MKAINPLYNKSYTLINNFISPYTKGEMKSKKKLFEKEFKDMTNCDEWFHYGYRSIIHEIKTFQFLSKYYHVNPFNSNNPGPDYGVEGALFECTIATFGKKGSEGYDSLLMDNYGKAVNYPRNLISLRITSAVKSKKEQYDKHIMSGVISPTQPYILVLDVSLLSVQRSLHIHNTEILHPFLGIGARQIKVNQKTSEFKDDGYAFVPNIKNSNNAEVELALFQRDEYNFLSAVLVIDTQIHKFTSVDNCVILKNFNAKNEFDFKDLKEVKIWEIQKDIYRHKFNR